MHLTASHSNMIQLKYTLLILLLVCGSVESAKVKKWTDEQGKVHYGERPPEHATSQELNGQVSSIKNDHQSNDRATLYSASWCGYCKKARSFMQRNNIAFDEYDIERNSVANREYQSMGGGGIPFLVHGKESLRGFNPKSYKRFFDIDQY